LHSNWNKPFWRTITPLALCLVLAITGVYAFRNDSTATNGLISERKLPIYCVQTDAPKVALSFDAAWGNEDTSTLLSILESHQVKATFFMTGGWVESYPDDVKAIAAAGHDLGNHSENHKQMSQLSASECKEEIQKVHDKVKELTGQDMTLFRPPYGDYNDTLVEAANSLGYHAIQWDVDSLDWKDYGADAIVSKVLNHSHLGNGSIILMHNGAKYTKDALDQVIEGLQEKGFELVPVSELIYTENYEMDHEGRQHLCQ
jgi:polysaccharide deacetylase family sporulation protein PdaB